MKNDFLMQGLTEANNLQRLINTAQLANTKDSLFNEWTSLEYLVSILKNIRDKIDDTHGLVLRQPFSSSYIDLCNKLFETYLNHDIHTIYIKIIEDSQSKIIEQLPDMIEYFEKYLELLYSNRSMDITIDIEILEVLSKKLK